MGARFNDVTEVSISKSSEPMPLFKNEVTQQEALVPIRSESIDISHTDSLAKATFPERTTYVPIPKPKIEGSEQIRQAVRIHRPSIAPLYRQPQAVERWWHGPALLIAAFSLVALGWVYISAKYKDTFRHLSFFAHPQNKTTQENPVSNENVRQPTSVDLQKSVLQKQIETGRELNRQRVATEIENFKKAPPLSESDLPKNSKTMMEGIPLRPEGVDEISLRDQSRRSVPASMDHPDNRIKYSLQEEQTAETVSRMNNKEFVREFLENARRDGYNVKLDSDMNVIEVVPIQQSRGPGSVR